MNGKILLVIVFGIILFGFASAGIVKIGGSGGGSNCGAIEVVCDLINDIIYWNNLIGVPDFNAMNDTRYYPLNANPAGYAIDSNVWGWIDGNRGGGDVNALVWVRQADGNVRFYKQIVDSDLGRGQVLNDAFAERKEGDVYYLAPAVFNIDNNQLMMNRQHTYEWYDGEWHTETVYTPHVAGLVGAGKYATIIKSSFENSGYTGGIINPDANSFIKDLSVIEEGAALPIAQFQDNVPAENLLIENVFVYGKIDGLYFGEGGLITVHNFDCYTNYDCVALYGGTIYVYDSNLVTSYDSEITFGSNKTRGAVNNGGKMYLFNTIINATNGVTQTYGVYNQNYNESETYVYGGKIKASSATGSVADLANNTNDYADSKLYVTANTDYNAFSTLGTISYADQNTIMKSLTSLPNASATTYFRGDGTWQTITSSTDTNWQTSWSVFDANMKAQYRKYLVDLNTSANVKGTVVHADNNFTLGTKAYAYDDGTYFILGRN